MLECTKLEHHARTADTIWSCHGFVSGKIFVPNMTYPLSTFRPSKRFMRVRSYKQALAKILKASRFTNQLAHFERFWKINQLAHFFGGRKTALFDKRTRGSRIFGVKERGNQSTISHLTLDVCRRDSSKIKDQNTWALLWSLVYNRTQRSTSPALCFGFMATMRKKFFPYFAQSIT